MKERQKLKAGPRAWAVLTLAIGAGLSSPFLRPPTSPVDHSLSESPLTRSGSRLPAASVAFSRPNELPWRDDPLLSASGGGATESEQQMPPWAEIPSRIDELIAEGAAPAAGFAPHASDIAPMPTWRDRQIGSTHLPNTAPRPAGLQPLASTRGPVPPPDSPTWEPGGLAPRLPQQIVRGALDAAWPDVGSAPPPARARPARVQSASQMNTAEPVSADRARPTAADAERSPKFVYQPGFKPQ